METRRWFNPHQPQTLQIAVFLLYFHAVFMVLGGYLGWFPWGILLVAISGGGGFGIANEKKWGYACGIASALSPFVLRWVFLGLDDVFGGNLINLMFEVALVALLVHPMSRDYERIWFK